MDYDDYDSIQLLSQGEVLEIYYQMLKKDMELAANETKGKNGFDGNVTEDDAKNLAEFCNKNHATPLSQALAEVITCLEWHNEKRSPPIQETAIYNSLLRLEKAATTSTWELYGQDYDGPLESLTCFEMNMLEQNASLYIVDLLSVNNAQILFFPLTDLHSTDVIIKWRIFEKIASIKLTPEETIYKQKLKENIDRRIQNEVKNWLDKELQKLKLSGKNSALKDTELLTKIIKDFKSHVTMCIDVIAFEGVIFEAAGCKYFDSLSRVVDEKFYPVCRQVMESMDEYQLCHKSFHVNMRDSCALSHACYLQLKELVNLLITRGKTGQCLELQDYNNIFAKFFMNLLQVLKSECHNRIKRAVEIEAKDSVHSEEKILSSAVIVLNCFFTVIDEWKHMEIEDEELQIAFLVKIADIVCDGAKIFAEALERRLEIPSIQSREYECARKACILANSVDHVRRYLKELPQQMQWSESLNILSGDPSNASLKEQVLRILNLIHQSMDAQLMDITTNMLNAIASAVQSSSEKPMSSWLQGQATNQSFEKFMCFLNEHLQTVHGIMKEELFPGFLSHLWSSILRSIQSGFQEGMPPEYAKTMKENIVSLREFFSYINMEESDLHKQILPQIMSLLELNSKTTVELQLEYYSQVAESIISPIEYLGHIAFQVGYKTIGQDIVDLYIKVQKGQRLPVRKFEMSELYVKVDLCPNTLFPNQVPYKTSGVTENLDNPVFNEFFQFSKLPASILCVKGAVIQVLVLNQDNSYSAEAVLLLNQVQNMSGLASLEFLPVYLMPLRKFDMSHISYQVLENRSKWDKNAKLFISKRNKLSKSHKKTLSCVPGRNMMCNFSKND